MELIEVADDLKKLSDNKVIGNPKLNKSKIIFKGKNNILFCENNININNSVLSFNGDNTLVYICSDLNNNFKLVTYHNSTVFIGKEVIMGYSVAFNVQESQNLIIGDDCIIGNQVNIYTSDYYPIYDAENKKRINYSSSVYIGDHVWIGRSVYISKGNKIGSGTIIADNTFLLPDQDITSNIYIGGNPARILKKEVFFTKDFVGNYRPSDTLNTQNYISDVFIYQHTNNETLDLNKIDELLKNFVISDRLDFIKKLFVKNKRRNRFYI